MKFARSLLLAIGAVVLTASIVFAASYSATYTITESNSNSYTMLASSVLVDNQYLADNNFMNANALDTRIQTVGGIVQPHMVVDDRTLTAVAVPADSQTNLYFTTGNSSLSAMDIITGYGGYLTTSDAIALELGNNFEVEIDGYVNTAAGSNKDIIYKQSAFRTYVSGATDITAAILATETESYGAGASTVDVYGVNWYGQTFQFTNTVLVREITLNVQRVNNPAGNFVVSIRATAGDVPTGADLASSTVVASTISTSQTDTTFTLASPITLTGGTRYAIVTACPSGDGTNRIKWYYNGVDGYANGRYCSSGDSGGSWAGDSNKDFRFSIDGEYENVTATANGVATGEHEVKVTADTTDLKIYIDTVEEDSTALGGASVPNNANNYTIMDNSTTDFMPYINYYKHTVGGTLIAHYEPNTMIIGTTLPDREGAAQNATITFGSNPAGVSVSLGGLQSQAQPAAGEEADTPDPDILPAAGTSDWFEDPDVSGSLLSNPLRPFVAIMFDTTTLSEMQAWRLLGLSVVIGATVLTIVTIPGHLMIAGIVAAVAIGAMVALTIFPYWALVFIIVTVAGGLVAERSPSL